MRYTNGYYCEVVDGLLMCTPYYKYKENGFKMVNAIPYGEIYDEKQ